MSEAKIEIKVGEVPFSDEGTEKSETVGRVPCPRFFEGGFLQSS
jgi:hypothetical protein